MEALNNAIWYIVSILSSGMRNNEIMNFYLWHVRRRLRQCLP